MGVYAVGDVQGCLGPLQRALEKISFDPAEDKLWLTGDLVNRGPDSLGVLRLVRSLGSAAVCVLGNHDLHLMAVALGHRPRRSKDTFVDVLNAPDLHELVVWMRHWPLLHHDARLGYTLVHAGIPPQWSLATAAQRAADVERVLQGDTPGLLLSEMYGDEPRTWQDDLVEGQRLRLITNYFTRMRFCTSEGELDLKNKEGPEAAPPGMAPWYLHSARQTKNDRIIFGHWATLHGRANTANIFSLDTGCVYGHELTLLDLATEQRLCLSCERHDLPGVNWP